MECQEATWQNWEGDQKCTAELCVADNLEDLREIIKKAKREGKTIRVANGGLNNSYSASFSGSPVVNNDGGIIVLIPKLNKARVHEDGSKRITAEAGMLLRDFTKFALENGLGLVTIPVPVFIQMGGAVALSCHGCGNDSGTISDTVVAMDIVTHDGTIKTITEAEPELLKAAQVNLGALGIMHNITLQCVDAYKLCAVDEFLPLKETIENIKDLVASHDYVELFWLPFTDEVWVKRWDKVPWDTPNKNVPGFWNKLQQMIQAQGGTLALKFALRFPRITPLLSKTLKKLTWTGERVAPSPSIFHYQEYFPRKLWDLSYAVECGDEFENLKSVWNLVIDKVCEYAKPKPGKSCTSTWGYQKYAKFPINFLMHIRFLNHSGGYLAPAVGDRRIFMFEAITYMGTADYKKFFDEIEHHLLKLGGRPHWGKTYSYNNLNYDKIYGEHMVKFKKIRQEMDPGGLFLNDFMRKVFSLQKQA